MKARPTPQTIASLKNAARLLTGAARRTFQAEVTQNHCHGSPRFAHELFGWNTEAIRKGIAENETNCILLDNRRTGCPRYLQKLPSWDGVIPNVYFLDKTYKRGIKLTKRKLCPYEERLIRTPLIADWSVCIKPTKTA